MKPGSAFSLCAAIAVACGGAPERAYAPSPREVATSPALAFAERQDLCAQEPGEPPPEPLERTYTGLAAKARCRRELDSIMGAVAGALGVACNYCHLVPDYRAMTQRKEIANWMAVELAPALRKHDGTVVGCNDCHTRDNRAVAKILGSARDPAFAVEWMTTHLVEDFETRGGAPLHCKSCHRGNLGSSEFRPKIILTDNLPARAD